MKLLALTLLAPLVASVSALAAPSSDTGSVTFHLSGFESDRGKAVCALFKEADWLQKGKGMPRTATVLNGKAACAFASVPHGTYAFAAFHDEDGDGEFDKRLGLPAEDYCFSNHAVPKKLRPPTFDEAKFNHSKTHTHQSCELR